MKVIRPWDNKKLIVIEGSDGCGKQTQSQMLVDALNQSMGSNFAQLIDFPDYESKTGQLVTAMLSGEFGKDAKSLNPYFTSPMYSLDRFRKMREIEESEDFRWDTHVYVCNRYTISNLIHQGARICDCDELITYWQWLYDFEFNKLELPKPTKTFYLYLPPSIIMDNIKKRHEETGKMVDINETQDYIEMVDENYRSIKGMVDWVKIACSNYSNMEDTMIPKEDIHRFIINILKAEDTDLYAWLFNYNP